MNKIIIAIVLVAFLAVYFTFRQADQNKEFMKTAEKAHAVVLKKEERAAGQKSRKEYWVTYSYNSRGGHTHTTQELLEYPDMWQSIREGQAIDIYFNRENPSSSHLAAALDRRLGIANKNNR